MTGPFDFFTVDILAPTPNSFTSSPHTFPGPFPNYLTFGYKVIFQELENLDTALKNMTDQRS